MATQTPANTKAAASLIREEDLEDMEKLQREIEGNIEQAEKDGRVYMMSQYVRILAGIKAEVKRIRNRFDRETLAGHRNATKELKKAQRAKDETQRTQGADEEGAA